MAKSMVPGKVMRQIKKAPDVYDMLISAPEIAGAAVAGQFVLIYPDDPSKILPRPISICEIRGEGLEKTEVRLVYRVTGKNTGTEELSQKQEGMTVRLMGPCGNGFTTDGMNDVLVVGGGIGIPPLLELCKELKGKKTAVLGYRDNNLFLRDEFEKFVDRVFIASEDGSVGTKGNVIDAITNHELMAKTVMACGPLPMLRALGDWAKSRGLPCFVSLEERMACGIGACLSCVCKSKEKDMHSHVFRKRICSEGPVFDAQDIII